MLPLRIRVIDHQTRQTVCDRSFTEMPVRIGRHEDNHLSLPYAFISAWHAEVRREGDALRLVDLGARNGLSVGARRLDAGAVVAVDGCLVASIGPLELRLEPTVEAAAAPVVDEAASDMPDFITGPRELAPKAGTIDADVLPELPDATAGAHAERIARINAAIHALRPKHAALDAARRAWEASLTGALQPFQSAADALATSMLLREFPARDRAGFALADAGGRFADEQERGAVAQTAAELLPGLRPPADEDEARRFLARVIDVLRVFAACALELQHTRAQQATELGVVWRDPTDPLAAMETPVDALRYLLDWRDAGEKRSEELVRLFSGLVDHQRAYARAGLLAAREAVSSLAPAEVERGAHAAWPSRAAALWRHYEACYAALAGDVHDHLTPLYRAALARGYAETLARVGVGFRVQSAPESP